MKNLFQTRSWKTTNFVLKKFIVGRNIRTNMNLGLSAHNKPATIESFKDYFIEEESAKYLEYKL